MSPLDAQLFAFLLLVAVGIGVGFLFDVFRVWRRLLYRGRWVQAAGDLVFLALAGVLLAGGLVLANWGELRVFVLLGLMAGLGLYFRLASAVAVRLMALVCGAVAAWLGKLVGWAEGRVRDGRSWSHRQWGRCRRVVGRPVRQTWRWLLFHLRRTVRWWRRFSGFL